MGHPVLCIHTSHLSAGDDRAGQRCSKQVSLFVDSVALDSAEAELVDELLAEILNDPFARCQLRWCSLCSYGKQHVHLGGTNLQGLCPNLIPRLVLANVGQEADNLISLLQEPPEDFWDRRSV